MARTAQEIIDQAISENKHDKMFLYGLTGLFALSGLACLVYGVANGSALNTIAGVVTGSFYIPALNAARQIHKEYIAIRLLESPLSQANTADDAARALQEIVKDILLRKSGGDHAET